MPGEVGHLKRHVYVLYVSRRLVLGSGVEVVDGVLQPVLVGAEAGTFL